MKVKVGGKVIPASFLKVEGRGALVGAKDRRGIDSVVIPGGNCNFFARRYKCCFK